ncbi:GNAT family N-acetyltransferase [bacterium]|nr:GNAT family N-acetyltransferase [bacterium]
MSAPSPGPIGPIRPMRADECAAVARLWSLAFRGGDALPEDRLAPKEGREIFVAEGEPGLVGAYELNATHFYVRGRRLSAGAIRSVAVSPECRQSGVGHALMRHSLSAMRGRGLAWSVLHPVRESYYARFGYAPAGRRIVLTCPLSIFPRLELDLPVRLLTLEDWPQVEGAYHAWAARYSGTHARSGFDWSRVHWSGEPTPAQVVAVGEPAEGFAVLRLKKGLRPAQEVSEVVWSSARGYRALLSALGRIGYNGATLTWPEPGDSPFWALFCEYGLEATVERPPMYRIIDAPAALRALGADGEGEFTLELRDPLLPENAGPWRVRFGAGSVTVEPASTAQLALDVRTAAQALLGEPSLADLAAATRLLPRFPTHCADFF